MRKLLLSIILFSMAIVVPDPGMARVDVSIGISLPPPFVFPAPPQVVVLPDTNFVYVVPDIDIELYFWNGWWWRLWEGRWYRSRYYDRGWVYYNAVPRFYYDVDPGWRRYYKERAWYGHRWDYQRIPVQRLHKNWRYWDRQNYWERKRTWNVKEYKPRPPQQRQELRFKRQQEYQKRPDVMPHQQQGPPQGRHPGQGPGQPPGRQGHGGPPR